MEFPVMSKETAKLFEAHECPRIKKINKKQHHKKWLPQQYVEENKLKCVQENESVIIVGRKNVLLHMTLLGYYT